MRRLEDPREVVDSLKYYLRTRSDAIELLGPPNRDRLVNRIIPVVGPDTTYSQMDYYFDSRCIGSKVREDVSLCWVYFLMHPGSDSLLYISWVCQD